MVKSIIISKHGGPEVLELKDVKVGSPGPEEIKIKNLAIGLNFIDTYHRSGLYPLNLPSSIGMEGAGIVEEIGPGVKYFNKNSASLGSILFYLYFYQSFYNNNTG